MGDWTGGALLDTPLLARHALGAASSGPRAAVSLATFPARPLSLSVVEPRPGPSLQVATSALISFADIVVSTDVTSDAAENDHASWGLAQELNTGMLLLRSSPGAAVVCEAWVDRMKQEMVSIEKLPKNMLQWWSNDQTFFNEVHAQCTRPPNQ